MSVDDGSKTEKLRSEGFVEGHEFTRAVWWPILTYVPMGRNGHQASGYAWRTLADWEGHELHSCRQVVQNVSAL